MKFCGKKQLLVMLKSKFERKKIDRLVQHNSKCLKALRIVLHSPIEMLSLCVCACVVLKKSGLVQSGLDLHCPLPSYMLWLKQTLNNNIWAAFPIK